jgi:hypothetical protein
MRVLPGSSRTKRTPMPARPCASLWGRSHMTRAVPRTTPSGIVLTHSKRTSTPRAAGRAVSINMPDGDMSTQEPKLGSLDVGSRLLTASAE